MRGEGVVPVLRVLGHAAFPGEAPGPGTGLALGLEACSQAAAGWQPLNTTQQTDEGRARGRRRYSWKLETPALEKEGQGSDLE